MSAVLARAEGGFPHQGFQMSSRREQQTKDPRTELVSRLSSYLGSDLVISSSSKHRRTERPLHALAPCEEVGRCMKVTSLTSPSRIPDSDTSSCRVQLLCFRRAPCPAAPPVPATLAWTHVPNLDSMTTALRLTGVRYTRHGLVVRRSRKSIPSAKKLDMGTLFCCSNIVPH